MVATAGQPFCRSCAAPSGTHACPSFSANMYRTRIVAAAGPAPGPKGPALQPPSMPRPQAPSPMPLSNGNGNGRPAVQPPVSPPTAPAAGGLQRPAAPQQPQRFPPAPPLPPIPPPAGGRSGAAVPPPAQPLAAPPRPGAMTPPRPMAPAPQPPAASPPQPQQPVPGGAPARPPNPYSTGPKPSSLTPPAAPAQPQRPQPADPFATLPKLGAAPPPPNPFDKINKPASPAPPAAPQASTSATVMPPPRPAAMPMQPPSLAQAPPPARPAMAAPTGPPPSLAPPPPRPPASAPSMSRPSMPGGPAGAGPSQLMSRAPKRDILAAQPPVGAPTTIAQDNLGASQQLIKPDPPSLRVLESLMPPAGQVAGKGRVQVEVVEDDDVPAGFDDEDAEFMTKTAKGGKGKGPAKRKEKITAEMRREARKQREAVRAERAASQKRDKEEIFEVGEEGMSLEQLAELLVVDPSDIVRALFMKGITLSMNQMLDKNTVKVVAAEYDVLVVDKDPEGPTSKAKKKSEFISDEDVDDLEQRPPVVTVMGHVDHGKTSLLDYIRKERVAAGEAGGITQAIGAYNTEVEVDGEKKTICFLDTPGHEAFSAMRARGAQVTDIAIIIVAADDGVRPQTREAVAHAQAADVPIVVAINKIDKPGADADRVKQELLELNLVPEEWGGSTPMVAVSAKKGQGIPDLLTQLLWVAEEKQLVANPKKLAQGTVIEAHLDKKRGPVSTLLVQAGTLRPGDCVRAGASYGKARSLLNDLGVAVPSAGPSIAVQLVGLNSVPAAGEEFAVYPSEAAAREAAAEFEDALRARRMAEMSGGGSMVTLSSLATVDEDQEALQRINLVVKADTAGMVEAIKAALSMLPQQSVTLRFLLSAAGDITVSDVDLAAASGAMVLAFNLNPDEAVLTHAKKAGVNVKSYKIIYELIDDVKAAMEGKLRLVEERVPQGTAVVKAVFGTGKKRVAGCAVTEGKLVKDGGYVTVRRGKAVVYEGKMSSLRRVKDIVDEVAAGLECGLGCDAFTDWAEGDTVECYRMVTKSRRLEDARATTAVDVASIA